MTTTIFLAALMNHLIADAGGMKNLVTVDGDGWALSPNPDHLGYRRA